MTCDDVAVRILLVEDDPGLAASAVDGLSAQGFTVDHVATGQAALDAVASASPAADVILLDNFDVPEMVEAVAYRASCGRPVILEASGGLTVERATAVGRTGVDFIAVGELTGTAANGRIAGQANGRIALWLNY